MSHLFLGSRHCQRGLELGALAIARTEALLRYAGEHPEEVLLAIDDKTDTLIRELEEQERDARRALRSPGREGRPAGPTAT